MPIAINGSGTITGISVGGLPDGIVDTDMLAAGAVTAPKRGAGAILQVVSATKTDTFTTTSTSAVAITGLSVSITPSSSSNKIFLIASIGAASTTTADYSTFFYFYRGGSLITGTVGDTESSCTSAAFSIRASHAARSQSTTGHFLDSPSSTSALTYQLYCSMESNGGNSVINRDGHSSQTSAGRPRNISSITVMEVAA